MHAHIHIQTHEYAGTHLTKVTTKWILNLRKKSEKILVALGIAVLIDLPICFFHVLFFSPYLIVFPQFECRMCSSRSRNIYCFCIIYSFVIALKKIPLKIVARVLFRFLSSIRLKAPKKYTLTKCRGKRKQETRQNGK